jgi:hypothetical protein
VEAKCITLRLTEAQRKVVENATGQQIEALTLPLDEIGEYVADPTALSAREEEAFIWECLNPYP